MDYEDWYVWYTPEEMAANGRRKGYEEGLKVATQEFAAAWSLPHFRRGIEDAAYTCGREFHAVPEVMQAIKTYAEASLKLSKEPSTGAVRTITEIRMRPWSIAYAFAISGPELRNYRR